MRTSGAQTAHTSPVQARGLDLGRHGLALSLALSLGGRIRIRVLVENPDYPDVTKLLCGIGRPHTFTYTYTV